MARHVSFDETAPSPGAAPWVERVWSVTWDLPDGVEHVNSIVPHPSVSLTVERGEVDRDGAHGPGVWVTGVVTHRFDAVCRGRGGVVGAKFHPGGFTALTGIPAAELNGPQPARGRPGPGRRGAGRPAPRRARSRAGPVRASSRTLGRGPGGRPRLRAGGPGGGAPAGPLGDPRRRPRRALRAVGPQPPAAAAPLRRGGSQVDGRAPPVARRGGRRSTPAGTGRWPTWPRPPGGTTRTSSPATSRPSSAPAPAPTATAPPRLTPVTAGGAARGILAAMKLTVVLDCTDLAALVPFWCGGPGLRAVFSLPDFEVLRPARGRAGRVAVHPPAGARGASGGRTACTSTCTRPWSWGVPGAGRAAGGAWAAGGSAAGDRAARGDRGAGGR